VICAANGESGDKKASKFMKDAGRITIVELADRRKANVEVYNL
jgi:hypothetical protein